MHSVFIKSPIKTFTYLSIVFIALVGCGNSNDSDTSKNAESHNCGLLADGSFNERVRYLSSQVSSSNECQSEVQKQYCSDGELEDWSGSYSFEQCEVIAKACGSIESGEYRTREMFAQSVVNEISECQKEQQTSQCLDGSFTSWSGSFEHFGCTTTQSSQRLLTKTDFEYLGGFRLHGGKFSNSENNTYATLDFSPGVIGLNAENQSLFVVGGGSEQGIAEFRIPSIVNSRDIADFVVGDEVLQNFAPFQNTERVDTGVYSYFRVTGLAHIDGKLVVNYFNWYDANGTETDTSVVFEDASNLESSVIDGPFQIDGAAHAGGWLTKIPEYFQTDLGGTYVSGWSQGSINSRLSVGPSAWVSTPSDNLLVNSGGRVEATALLDFPLNHLLYDKAKYPQGIANTDDYLYNLDLNNDLWTIGSTATYGIIIPDTGTYMTVGRSYGHEYGAGYKIVQDDGTNCAGPCPKVASDKGNHYWLWKVSDLIKVKKGELLAYDVRPYEYGILDLPSEAAITSGAYDHETKRLYLALAQGDTTGTYSRPPIYFVLKIN